MSRTYPRLWTCQACGSHNPVGNPECRTCHTWDESLYRDALIAIAGGLAADRAFNSGGAKDRFARTAHELAMQIVDTAKIGPVETPDSETDETDDPPCPMCGSKIEIQLPAWFAPSNLETPVSVDVEATGLCQCTQCGHEFPGK